MNLLYSYAGRLIYWSRKLGDRYVEDDFSTELSVELAVRLVEAEWFAFSAAAPAGVRWNLQFGEVEGLDQEAADTALGIAEARAHLDLDDIEREAAGAVQRRQRLLAAQTPFVEDASPACPTYIFDKFLTLGYPVPHGYINAAQAPRRGLMRKTERCAGWINDHRKPAHSRGYLCTGAIMARCRSDR